MDRNINTQADADQFSNDTSGTEQNYDGNAGGGIDCDADRLQMQD
jgi:hypothetical protein